MNINVHHTKTLEMSPVKPVNDKYYRVINVITDKGEHIEVTLFANTKEELEVTL